MRLDRLGIIKRYKTGRSMEYAVYWTSLPGRLLDAAPVRQADYTSPPGRLVPVRQADSNNTNEKEQSNKSEMVSHLEDEKGQDKNNPGYTLAALLARAKARGLASEGGL